MSHLNLDKNTDTWHVVLVYLATNGQLIETAKILDIDKSKAGYRLGIAGVITRTSCPANTVTASQDMAVISSALEYAAGMTDRFEAERLVEQVQEHRHNGTELLISLGKTTKRQQRRRKYQPQPRADGTYPWWVHADGLLPAQEAS